MKNKVSIILFFIILLKLPSKAFSYIIQKENVIFLFGAIHSNKFNTAKTIIDTTNITNLLPFSRIPSWGYFVGIHINKNFIEKRRFHFDFGIEYNLHTYLKRTDSINAIFNKKYFLDPLIRSNTRSNIFAIPFHLGVKYKLISIYLGVTNSFLVWYSNKDYLLSGQVVKNHSKMELRIHSYFSGYINYLLLNKFSINFGYEKSVFEGWGSDYYRFGLLYQLNKN